jgi:hypothetical protein
MKTGIQRENYGQQVDITTTLSAGIRAVPLSNLEKATSYPDGDDTGRHQFLRANARTKQINQPVNLLTLCPESESFGSEPGYRILRLRFFAIFLMPSTEIKR